MVAKVLGLGLAVALVLSFGCGKKKDTGMTPDQQQQMLDMQKQMQPAAEEAAKVVEAAKEEVKAVGEKVEGEVKAVQSSFDALVAEAKALIDGKKYQDALTKLQAGMTAPGVTAEQKTALQKLIDQAKAALAGGAAQDAQKAAGDALKGLGGKK